MDLLEKASLGISGMTIEEIADASMPIHIPVSFPTTWGVEVLKNKYTRHLYGEQIDGPINVQVNGQCNHADNEPIYDIVYHNVEGHGIHMIAEETDEVIGFACRCGHEEIFKGDK